MNAPLTLDPCPFCGEQIDLRLVEAEFASRQTRYAVWCRACGATGPGSMVSRTNAAASWNFALRRLVQPVPVREDGEMNRLLRDHGFGEYLGDDHEEN